jgi:biotin carboxylase
MATLICLGGGLEGVPILKRAKAMGHRLVVVDKNPAAPGMALGDMRVWASCYDAHAVLAALESEFGGFHFDGVLCCAVDAPHVAAAVAAAYHLPGLAPERAALSVDKLAQKRALHAAGLPVPNFYEVGNAYIRDDFQVIKPADSRGARGVALLMKDADWPMYYQEAKDASPTGRVVVEEYLPGPQLSTESIIERGKVAYTAVALRNYDRPDLLPNIVENGCDAPWGVEDDFAMWPALSDLLVQACRALGWFQDSVGVVKGDLVISGGQPVILELAARLSGGFLCTHTIPLAYGFDLVEYAIRSALGEDFTDMRLWVDPAWQFTSQRYVFPDSADIGKRVVSVPAKVVLVPDRPDWRDFVSGALDYDSATEHEPLKFATYAVRPGDVLRPVTDHGARLGQAIATGATPEQARAHAEQAVAAMKAALVLA